MINNENMPTVEERHERGFTGVWVPWFLFDLLDQGTLNARDLLMLCTIASFCKHGKCFASNAYLGRCIGVSASRANSIISKLKKLKLIEQVGFDGRRRTLKICYDENKISPVDSPKIGRQTSRKKGGRLPENRDIEYKGEEKELEKKISMLEPAGSNQARESSTPGPENGQVVPKKKKQPTSFDFRAAEELWKVVQTHRKVQKNSELRGWANQIRQMREVDEVSKEDIRKTIEWYAVYIGQEYMPEAFSARTFRQKYKDGKFTAAMRRTSRETSSNGNGKVARLSNGRQITHDNMYESENCYMSGVPRIWADYDGKQYDGKLVEQVRRRCQQVCEGRLYVHQDELDAVLKELGLPMGCVPLTVAGG